MAAIIANLHDVVIILGFFAFFQWEFSLPVLAAVLAVLGYSVNESVVVFDRIRENFRKMRKASVPQIIDNAITSTMSRTIITHGCTQLMVMSMLLFGGPALHYFALALTIGILLRHLLLGAGGGAAGHVAGRVARDLVKPEKKRSRARGCLEGGRGAARRAAGPGPPPRQAPARADPDLRRLGLRDPVSGDLLRDRASS